MFLNKSDAGRCRGRPRCKTDRESRGHIVEVAYALFRTDGYAATGMGAIARSAGVSTKTVYRLFPGKADLLAEAISNQVDGFLMRVDLDVLRAMDLREGLTYLMTAYGTLTLSDDGLRLAKLVVNESVRFPEVGAAFYESAVLPTNRVIEGWLRERKDIGELAILDPEEASGILRGMMIMEPQRASLLVQAEPLEAGKIAQRARDCVDRFLQGCGSKAAAPPANADLKALVSS